MGGIQINLLGMKLLAEETVDNVNSSQSGYAKAIFIYPNAIRVREFQCRNGPVVSSYLAQTPLKR